VARGLNQVNLIGYLGRDPELRYTPQATAVCNMSLGVTERFKEKERTTWVELVAWGKLAEVCGEYLTKGKQVFISGSLQEQQWERDGVKQRRMQVRVNEMVILGGGGSGSGKSNVTDSNEDIPF